MNKLLDILSVVITSIMVLVWTFIASWSFQLAFGKATLFKVLLHLPTILLVLLSPMWAIHRFFTKQLYRD